MINPLTNPALPYLCAICGKPVDLTTCKTDEHGRAVHAECIAGKVIEMNHKKRRSTAAHS